MQKEKSILEFFTIIANLIENTKHLMKYDTFGANSIASVINLILSRDENYVKFFNISTNDELDLPEELNEAVNHIVKSIKEKLEGGKENGI